MLNKVKKLNDLRRAQARIQKQLESIGVTDSRGRFRVRVRGDKRIDLLEIDGVDAKDLRDLINQVMKKVDKKVQKRLQGELGGLGLDL